MMRMRRQWDDNAPTVAAAVLCHCQLVVAAFPIAPPPSSLPPLPSSASPGVGCGGGGGGRRGGFRVGWLRAAATTHHQRTRQPAPTAEEHCCSLSRLNRPSEPRASMPPRRKAQLSSPPASDAEDVEEEDEQDEEEDCEEAADNRAMERALGKKPGQAAGWKQAAIREAANSVKRPGAKKPLTASPPDERKHAISHVPSSPPHAKATHAGEILHPAPSSSQEDRQGSTLVVLLCLPTRGSRVAQSSPTDERRVPHDCPAASLARALREAAHVRFVEDLAHCSLSFVKLRARIAAEDQFDLRRRVFCSPWEVPVRILPLLSRPRVPQSDLAEERPSAQLLREILHVLPSGCGLQPDDARRDVPGATTTDNAPNRLLVR